MAMAMRTSFFTKSLASLPRRRVPFLTSPPTCIFKNGVSKQRFVLLKVKCDLEGSKRTAKSESDTITSNAAVAEDDRVISSYRWCTALGGVGFLEMAYLTLSKLTDSDVLCPIGQGSCSAILNSDFASLFGVPPPLYGMVAYGLVAILGLRLQLVPHNTTFDVQKKDETILIRITTSIDVATTYFLYVLSIEFGAESYFYCLTSSALTFSLFFIILKLGSDINTICGKRDHERVQSYGRFSGKTFTLLEKNSMELSGSRIVCIRKRIDVWARSS